MKARKSIQLVKCVSRMRLVKYVLSCMKNQSNSALRLVEDMIYTLTQFLKVLSDLLMISFPPLSMMRMKQQMM